jgi:hypothetical protein
MKKARSKKSRDTVPLNVEKQIRHVIALSSICFALYRKTMSFQKFTVVQQHFWLPFIFSVLIFFSYGILRWPSFKYLEVQSGILSIISVS